jgi:dimethylaniline monooxygenase (N-oxide forming)
VIGAGPCGIVASKVLVDAGFDVTCFEGGGEIGGLWVYRNSNGLAAAYRSLHANTTGASMAYSDLPMPRSFADYPHRADVVAYLVAYVDRFRLRERIRFWSTVTRIEPRGPEGWDVTVETTAAAGEGAQTTRQPFDAVVVASGHHWDPQWPDPPYAGAFGGRQLHAHDYREPLEFAGRRVLVVGMGNSAMDMAVELSVVADRTYISARSGTHILPKYLFGRPIGHVTRWLNHLPWPARQALLDRVLRVMRGGYARYGLQEPARGIYQSHPTLSDTILSRIAHGEIAPKPGIRALEGSRVRFVDDSTALIDVIIWCTGYRVNLPFLRDGLVPVDGNQVPLYKRVFPIGVPNLAFVGLVQQRGAMMPIAEEQSRLIGDALTGRYRLPPVEAMAADIRAYDREIARRYVGTQRHTMEVEQAPYIAMLRRERARGTTRRAGGPAAAALRRSHLRRVVGR